MLHRQRYSCILPIYYTGQLLAHYPGRNYLYSEVSINWTSLAKSARPGVGLNFVIGGLGAHIVALDERAPEFHTHLREHLKSLRKLLIKGERLREKKLVSTMQSYMIILGFKQNVAAV